MDRSVDLRPELRLDLLQIRMVLIEGLGGREKIAVRIDERRDGGSAQNWTPAIILPLRIEREMDADGYIRMPLHHVHRLEIPRGRDHHRRRNGDPRRDELFERHVDAVAHSRIIAANYEIPLVDASGMLRCVGLTKSLR